MFDNLAEKHGVPRLSELGRVFLGDDRIDGERLRECPTNECLTAEVGHSHRTLIFLVKDLRPDPRPDRTAKLRCLTDGANGFGLFMVVSVAQDWLDSFDIG